MTMPNSPAPTPPATESDEVLPTFSEQVASQLGGLRGMVESSVPVLAFVAVNIMWGLTAALIVAVTIGVAIALFRLARKQSVRHAMNGLFGIAHRRGHRVEDRHPPGLLSAGHPAQPRATGWRWPARSRSAGRWSAGCGRSWPIRGATRWRDDSGLRRIFGWLTALWAATYLTKVVVNLAVYFAAGLSDDQKASILGIMRITLGWPPYALLVALTAWAARRYLRTRAAEPAAV